MKQISKLIDISIACEQYIKYECYDSKLLKDGRFKCIHLNSTEQTLQHISLLNRHGMVGVKNWSKNELLGWSKCGKQQVRMWRSEQLCGQKRSMQL